MAPKAVEVFKACVSAMDAGKFIRRESRQDKEFHFQNWFRDRLSETGMNFELGGRNSYPGRTDPEVQCGGSDDSQARRVALALGTV